MQWLPPSTGIIFKLSPWIVFFYLWVFASTSHAQALIDDRFRFKFETTQERWVPFLDENVEIEPERAHEVYNLVGLSQLWDPLLESLGFNPAWINWFPYFSNRFFLEIDQPNDIQDVDLDLFDAASVAASVEKVSARARQAELKQEHLARFHLDNKLKDIADALWEAAEIAAPYTIFREEALQATVESNEDFILLNSLGNESQVLEGVELPLRSVFEQAELGIQINYDFLIESSFLTVITRHGWFGIDFSKPLFIEFRDLTADNVDEDEDVDIPDDTEFSIFLVLPKVVATGISNDITIGFESETWGAVFYLKEESGNGTLDFGKAAQEMEEAFDAAIQVVSKDDIYYYGKTYAVDLFVDTFEPFSFGYSYRAVFRKFFLEHNFTDASVDSHHLEDDFFSHRLVVGLVF